MSTDDLLEMIDLAVRNMPEQRRRVFCMSRYENMSYNDIAEALNISPKTVETHKYSVLTKLRAGSINELTKMAIRLGLVSL